MLYINKNGKSLRTKNYCVQCNCPRHPKAKPGLCHSCIWKNNKKTLIEECSDKVKSWGYEIVNYEFDKHNHLAFNIITPCCKTEFYSVFGNLTKGIINLQSKGIDRMPCPKCGGEERIGKALEGFIEKYGRDYDIAEYEDYNLKVRQLSEQTYRNNKSTINPLNYKRGHRDYHLDHIFPVIECFKQGLSIEFASSIDNLQMLPYDENIRKHCKIL